MSPTFARVVVLALVRRVVGGRLVIVEGGRRREYGAGAPLATVEVHSARFWPMALRGSSGLADAYEQRLWDSPDLVVVIRLAALNVFRLDRMRRLIAPVLLPVQRLRDRRAQDPRARNRRDIAAHYDLGNELFTLMLDSTMTYSCAVFEDEHLTLEEAQLAKLDRICEKLDIRPGERVLEIGTGWGGFAVHAAATRGCHVTTTTISQEQYEYAVERVARAGLEQQVTVLAKDYRDLRGSYDKLVSIEMIEAVGWRHFGTFFRKCSELLEANGAMLLQAITIDDRAYELEKASRSFMATRIFPGGCLPSLEAIAHNVARHTDLQAVDLEDLTPHYVETLRRWRANFSTAARALRSLGYDERFHRIWTLYLAYCEAGFAERRIGDVQLVLAKPRWRGAARAVGAPSAVSAAGRELG